MPIYSGNADDAQAKWATILEIAKTCPWAEQSGFSTGNSFTKWPRSMYKSLGTNSNTFVHYLVVLSGLGWVEMDGLHPGSETPEQNIEEDLGRTLTFYEDHTPWLGLPAKSHSGGSPP